MPSSRTYSKMITFGFCLFLSYPCAKANDRAKEICDPAPNSVREAGENAVYIDKREAEAEAESSGVIASAQSSLDAYRKTNGRYKMAAMKLVDVCKNIDSWRDNALRVNPKSSEFRQFQKQIGLGLKSISQIATDLESLYIALGNQNVRVIQSIGNAVELRQGGDPSQKFMMQIEEEQLNEIRKEHPNLSAE